MLCQPAFIPGQHSGDTECEALLTQQGVSAVAGTVGPDSMFFRELGDIFVLHICAWPDSVVRFAISQWLAHRVETWDKLAVSSNGIKYFLAHTGHDDHVAYNIFRICDLDSILGNRRAHRTHAVRNHIHCASFHAACVKLCHGLLQLHRIDPVVCRTCIFLFL